MKPPPLIPAALIELSVDDANTVLGGAYTSAAVIRVEDLIRLSATGNLPAFNALYLACSARVFGFTHRILQDYAQAEEVTQEIFVQIWKQADRFDETLGSAMAWIMTVTHRRAVDRVRTSQSSRDRDLAHHTAGFSRDFDSVAEGLHTRSDAAEVRFALATLTALQRESIILAFFGGYTHIEISVLLDLPIGTVKSRIRDGLVRLRNQLPTAS